MHVCAALEQCFTDNCLSSLHGVVQCSPTKPSHVVDRLLIFHEQNPKIMNVILANEEVREDVDDNLGNFCRFFLLRRSLHKLIQPCVPVRNLCCLMPAIRRNHLDAKEHVGKKNKFQPTPTIHTGSNKITYIPK